MSSLASEHLTFLDKRAVFWYDLGMKQKLIFISGLAASGKTAVGELLHNRLENCARLEADFLILVKPFDLGDKLSGLRNRNVVSMVHNFLDENYENILIIGAVWSQNDLGKFLKEFSVDVYSIFVFWLDLSRDSRLARAAKRQDVGDNKEWFEKVEASIPTPELPLKGKSIFSYKIEVTNKSSKQIEEEIYKLLN